jgi:hypothetical protein
VNSPNRDIWADVLFEITSADRKDDTTSPARSRLPLSQCANEDSQPSSLILAVSSETLSVGIKLSMPAILRKSLIQKDTSSF